MLSVRIVQIASMPLLKSSTSTVGYFSKVGCAQSPLVRFFASDVRQNILKSRRRRRTFGETILQPSGETAFNVGKAAVAGGAVVGLGALCFYGLGLASEPGAIDTARLWPDYVKERIRSTYMFFGASLGISAGTAAALYRTAFMKEFLMGGSLLAIGISFIVLIGTSMSVQNLPYTKEFGPKHIAWVIHSAVVGGVLAPILVLGGPILTRAAWYTLGVVGGLSTVAVCAPSERFLNMGGPLAIGLGVVFASSLGGMFLPPTTALGAGLYSISLYGGLLLFSAFLLYDTQRIIKKAETHPIYTAVPYDPINASLSIYMDTINIFIRIATILSGGGSRKR